MQPIYTRLHKLLEIATDETFTNAVHHYVIGDDLLAALSREDVQKSIDAMIQADMARLPFPEMLVEYSVSPGVSRFLWLEEKDGDISALTAMLTSNGLVTVAVEPAIVRTQAGVLRVECKTGEEDAMAVAVGTSFALLMLNIRGIEKRIIEPKALNASRAKKGRVSVPSHVLLKIGVVYTKEGKAVIHGSDSLKTVYLRAGHVRQQAVGKGWSSHRPVYIAPQLVNYRDGAEIPKQKMRVVEMG